MRMKKKLSGENARFEGLWFVQVIASKMLEICLQRSGPERFWRVTFFSLNSTQELNLKEKDLSDHFLNSPKDGT